MDRLVSAVYYHDYLILFYASGAIYRMRFDSQVENFSISLIGHFNPVIS